MTQELCLNIWFIVDIGSDLCYNWSAKAYNLVGTEEEKLNLLNKLSESDYLTVPRLDIPQNNITVYDNIQLKGKLPSGTISDFFEMNFEYFISTLEVSLPKILNPNGKLISEENIKEQKFSDAPLFKFCTVAENEFGEMRAITNEENQKWVDAERIRIKSSIV